MFQENRMKVVAFNGSARKDGNTAILIRRVFSSLEAEGIETELVQLAGKTIKGCNASRIRTTSAPSLTMSPTSALRR